LALQKVEDRDCIKSPLEEAGIFLFQQRLKKIDAVDMNLILNDQVL
jgi:hypothetical protein